MCVIGEKTFKNIVIGPGKLPGLSRNGPQVGEHHSLYKDLFYRGSLNRGSTEFTTIACLCYWSGFWTFTLDPNNKRTYTATSKIKTMKE